MPPTPTNNPACLEHLTETELSDYRERKALSTTSLESFFIELSPYKDADFTTIAPTHFGTSHATIERNRNTKKIHVVKPFSNDAIQEFIAGALFKRTLYDKTPTINMTSNGRLTSKYIGSNQSQLRPLKAISDANKIFILSSFKGLEEIIASCMLWGDIDLNYGNLVPFKSKGTRKLCKIDHGWALTSFFTQEAEMRYAFFKQFSDYLRFIYISKLCEEIDKVCSISDEEIKGLVFSRIQILKNLSLQTQESFTVGIDSYLVKNEAINYGEWGFANLNDYGNFICECIIKQKETLKEVRKTIKLIEKVESTLQYPAQYRKHTMTIQNPIYWAYVNLNHANNARFKNPFRSQLFNNEQEAYNFCAENNLDSSTINLFASSFPDKLNESSFQSSLNCEPDFKAPDQFIIHCLRNKLKINDEDPIVYAMNNNSINGRVVLYCAKHLIPISNLDPLDFAVKNSIIIKSMPPLSFALKYGRKINEMKPIDYWDPQTMDETYKHSVMIFICCNYAMDLLKDGREDKLKFTLDYAMKHDLKMNGIKAEVFAMKYEIPIAQQTPQNKCMSL